MLLSQIWVNLYRYTEDEDEKEQDLSHIMEGLKDAEAGLVQLDPWL